MNDRIDDFFEREREAVPLLAPPSGTFEQLQHVARRRRNRNTTAVSVAAAVVVAVAGTGTVLGGGLGGGASRNSVQAGTTTLAGYSATPSAGASSTGVDPTVPTDFKAWSITFIKKTAWVIGTHSCGSQQCAVILQTTSYPFPWHAIATPDGEATQRMGLSAGTATIRMANDNDGWIVDAQQVLSTHDGGRSWAPVTELAGQHVTALEDWGQKTYALGPNGDTIWLSTDTTADHWIQQDGIGLPNAGKGSVDSLFPDSDAVAAVRTTGTSTSVSVSTNDGHNWTQLTLPCGPSPDGPAPLYSLLDFSVGRVICGNGDTYRVYTDRTKAPVATGTLPLAASQKTPVVARSIASNDVVTVAAYSGAGLWATYDHGVTWQKQSDGDFRYVGLTDDHSGVALTTDPSNAFWITYDGGKAWEPHTFR